MMALLLFEEFDLGNDVTSCDVANVTIYDDRADDDTAKLATFCEQDLPAPLHSSWRHLLLDYRTDGQGNGTGFVVIVSFMNITAEACKEGDSPPEELTWATGGLTSPGWPGAYPTATCLWTFPALQTYRLEFVEWDLPERGKDYDCAGDHVEVTTISREPRKYCGKYKPDPIGGVAGDLTLSLEAFQSTGHKGFRARYSRLNVTDVACGPGAVLDFSPGLLEPPPTATTSTCRWQLASTIAKRIRLWVLTFDVPCDGGVTSLDVYDGADDATAPLIGAFCGVDGWQGDIVFSGQSGLIMYRTAGTQPAWFELMYDFDDVTETACSTARPAALAATAGRLASPYYGQGNYPPGSNCQWRIVAKPGEVIELKVEDMKIEFCSGCMCDWLQMFNGGDPLRDPSIIKYCGSFTPRTVVTTVPAAYLTFHSDASDQVSAGFSLQYRVFNLSDWACDVGRQPAGMEYAPGDIMSPVDNVRGGYPPGAACRWRITSADLDARIELGFSSFDVGNSELGCPGDRVVVYDGPVNTSNILGTYCGNRRPNSVRSSSNYLLVEFISFDDGDDGIFQGFSASYTFKAPSSGPNIRFIPLLFLTLAVVCMLCMLVTYCQFPDKLRKLRVLFRRRPRSNTVGQEGGGGEEGAAGGEQQAAEDEADQPVAAAGEAEAAAQASTRRVEQTGGAQQSSESDPRRAAVHPVSIARPPSTVDEHHYYAIADYPPPAYDEIRDTATIEGVRQDPDSVSQSRVEITTAGPEEEPTVRYVHSQRSVTSQRSATVDESAHQQQNNLTNTYMTITPVIGQENMYTTLNPSTADGDSGSDQINHSVEDNAVPQPEHSTVLEDNEDAVSHYTSSSSEHDPQACVSEQLEIQQLTLSDCAPHSPRQVILTQSGSPTPTVLQEGDPEISRTPPDEQLSASHEADVVKSHGSDVKKPHGNFQNKSHSEDVINLHAADKSNDNTHQVGGRELVGIENAAMEGDEIDDEYEDVEAGSGAFRHLDEGYSSLDRRPRCSSHL